MAQLVIPDETLLREPGLLVPGRKPVGPVRVDWSHPLARGLLSCLTMGGDLASGVPLSIPGNKVATQFGVGADLSTDTGSNTFPVAENLIVKPLVNDFTVYVQLVGDQTLDADKDTYYHYVVQGGQYRGIGVSVQHGFNSDSCEIVVWFGATDDDSSSRVFSGTGGYVITRSGATVKFYGRNSSTVSATDTGFSTSNFTTNADRRAGFCYFNESRWKSIPCETRPVSGMFWNRVLTDGEISSLQHDPYQFLIPA